MASSQAGQLARSMAGPVLGAVPPGEPPGPERLASWAMNTAAFDAACHSCIRSGRWSARGDHCKTCGCPSRAARRSSSCCKLSPGRCASGSRLALCPARGRVSTLRNCKYSTGAGRLMRARCSASRRCRWAVSQLGSAQRSSNSPWLAVSRRASMVQHSTSASTACWRSCSQYCSCSSSRRAPNSSAGAVSTCAASSSLASNTSGSSSQG